MVDLPPHVGKWASENQTMSRIRRQPVPERRRKERREVDFYHVRKPRMDERVDEHHCSAVAGLVGASHPPPTPRD